MSIFYFGVAIPCFLPIYNATKDLRSVKIVYSRAVHAPPRGVLLEKFGGGVRPTSQNSYAICDQNLRFLLPYLWPGQKFDTLFMTVAAGTVALNISYEGLLLTFLLIKCLSKQPER